MNIPEGLRTVILLSGSGTTADAVAESTLEGKLKGKIFIPGAIATRSDAGGIQKLTDRGIDVRVLDRKSLGRDKYAESLYDILDEFDPEVISQNGLIVKTAPRIVKDFTERGTVIINQHPGALDPGRVDPEGQSLDFGGEGMYGLAPTLARLAYVWATNEYPVTESTVHMVTESGYDNGAILNRKEMLMPHLPYLISIEELAENPKLRAHLLETATAVQKQLLSVEHQTVIDTLDAISRGEITIFERPKPLIPEGNEHILFAAKQLAVNMLKAA